MLPYLSSTPGNASSLHAEGRRARDGVEDARDLVARLVGARSDECVFTGGGTEADNLAVIGIATARAARADRRVVVSAIEHHAVLHAADELSSLHHFQVDSLGVDGACRVSVAGLEERLEERPALVCVMAANNETGALQPIAELGAACERRGVPLFTDAVQWIGHEPFDFGALPVAAATLSAHKLHGPQGVGALLIRRGTPLFPRQWGGRQERARRAGTENVAGIVGMARALELALSRRVVEHARLSALTGALRAGIERRIADCVINTPRERALAHILNVSFKGVEGEAVLLALNARGIACATGSACTSEALEPSHVLRAMGVPDEVAQGSLRFSLGRGTTATDIDRALDALVQTVSSLRQLSPLYGP